MPQNWYLIFSFALIESFVIAILLTALMRVLALRLGVVDRPGERKMHKEPVPLLGGVAIYLTFNLVILSNLGLLMLSRNWTSPGSKIISSPSSARLPCGPSLGSLRGPLSSSF